MRASAHANEHKLASGEGRAASVAPRCRPPGASCGSPSRTAQWAQSNAEQRRAATQPASCALVVYAPAGAGKTLTLVLRIAHLVEAERLRADELLCLTFSRKAAAELKERLRLAVRAPVEALTFHAWCLRLLRTFAPRLGLAPDFSLSSTAQQLGLVQQSLQQWQRRQAEQEEGGGAHGKEISAGLCRKLHKAIQMSKAMASSACGDASRVLETELGAFVRNEYETALRRSGMLDLSDLQNLATRLMHHEEVAAMVRARYKHVLVDEYQDTNALQLALICLLRGTNGSGADHTGVTVVGDDDQSIYAFRGAQPGIFEAFSRQMADCRTVTLEQNYRSSKLIIKAALAVISEGHARACKRLWTANPVGEKIKICECRTSACETDWITLQIEQLQASAVPLSDVAVLYRTHAVGKQVQQALRERAIPFTSASADVFNRGDVAQLLSLLRLIASEGDSSSFQVVASAVLSPLPARLLQLVDDVAIARDIPKLTAARAVHSALNGICRHAGDDALAAEARRLERQDTEALHALLRTMDALVAAAQTTPPAQLIARVVQDRVLAQITPGKPPHGIRLLAEEFDKLDEDDGEAAFSSSSGARSDPDGCMTKLRSALEHAALSEAESCPSARKGAAVTLSTIHGAKGREWPIVMLMRVNEEELPLCLSDEPEQRLPNEQLAEERRLMYVALTRAKLRLFLSYVTEGPDRQQLQVSRFLRLLPPDTFEREHHYDLESRPKPKPVAPSPFTPFKGQPAELPQGVLGEQIRKWHAKAAEKEANSKRKRSAPSRSKENKPSNKVRGDDQRAVGKPPTTKAAKAASNAVAHDVAHSESARLQSNASESSKGKLLASGRRRKSVICDDEDFE